MGKGGIGEEEKNSFTLERKEIILKRYREINRELMHYVYSMLFSQKKKCE
jgi:hypothetical protein